MSNEFSNEIEDTAANGAFIKITADVSIMENDIGEIFQTLMSLAKAGDIKAAELVFDRTIPKIKPITQRTFILRHEDYDDLENWYEKVIFMFNQGVLTYEQANAQLSIMKDKYKNLLEDFKAYRDLYERNPLTGDSTIH